MPGRSRSDLARNSRIVNAQAQANSLGLQKFAIVKLTGIERWGERGDLPRRLDRLARPD